MGRAGREEGGQGGGGGVGVEKLARAEEVERVRRAIGDRLDCLVLGVASSSDGLQAELGQFAGGERGGTGEPRPIDGRPPSPTSSPISYRAYARSVSPAGRTPVVVRASTRAVV